MLHNSIVHSLKHNQLFYNIASGIVHQIRREKRSDCCISPSDCEANRDGADAESPFPLFFSFSASFKNSSSREKVAKLSSFRDWWAEPLFVSILLSRNIMIFFPVLTMVARAKKNSGEAICSRYQRALSGF